MLNNPVNQTYLSPRDLMKNLDQYHPLHLPPPTPLLIRPESENSEEELNEIRIRRQAQYWPCSNCTFLLGFFHLFSGIILLFFDIFTNYITHTPFAISASLFFIICAIFSFIALRWVINPQRWKAIIISHNFFDG